MDLGDVDALAPGGMSSMNAENESINLKSATKTAGSFLARSHLALSHALAEELVDGGAGVQDSADGAILHKLV